MSRPDPSRADLAPPPVAADVGIVMAMPIEAGSLLDSLGRVRRYSARARTIVEGEVAGKVVVVTVAGVGKAAARRGAELLAAGHRPRTIISAGFAGALDPALARDALVLPHEVSDGQDGPIEPDHGFPIPSGIEHRRGRLLTVERVVTRSAEKAALREQHGADLIDMETSAVAGFARERAIRFIALRIISDTADEELPQEIAGLLAQSGSYRVGHALRAIWQRPSAVKDFWSLHARALASADRLARGLIRIIEALPES
ncbi:MAG: nucleoside phosphorylase [Isosphaeraceae bacterium]